MRISLFLIIIVMTIVLIYAFQAYKLDRNFETIRLSKLKIEGKMGQEIFSQDSSRPTVLIWFHPDCEHCQYQLTTINCNMERLQMVRFLFITDEKTFFSNNYRIKWPDLVQSSKTIFGIIEKSRFIREFGPVITPSLLFFNHDGILKKKLLGEVKIEKIVQLINNHPVPEQMISGSN